MYVEDSPYHRIKVAEANGVRTLRFERNQQSSMRLDAPFETDLEYVGYLHLPLAVMPSATRTLVIGLGAGMLVKRMWRDYPAMHLDAVELDPAVAEIARVLFELPNDPRITVIVGDGRDYLQATNSTYDIIIIDAFDDNRVPRPLTTEECFRAARDHLSPDGAFAMNVIGSLQGSHSREARSIYRTLGNVWRNVRVFVVESADNEGESTRNLILLAYDADLSDETLLERIASRVDGLVTITGFEMFGGHLHRESIRGGDVPILSDEPSQRGR